VGDDHHVSGGVVIERDRQFVDELGRAPVEVAHGLAAARARVGVGHPVRVQAGRDRVVGGRGKPLEHAQRPLAESGVGGDGQPEHRREGGGGLPRAAQVAGVDRADRAVAERPGGVGRLGQAAVGQLGQVVVPLGQARDVPGRLAVPDQP